MKVKKVLLGPIESATVKELSEIIKKGKSYRLFSDKEFNELILSRRPLELILMAEAAMTCHNAAESH